MKFTKLLLLTLSVPLLLISCNQDNEQNPLLNDDDEPIVLSLDQPSLKIMQLTDLHLTYGIDYNDRQTFKLIERLAEHSEPDLIVLTGDLTMSPLAPALYGKLGRVMDNIGIPWTFVLGNHDSDFNNHERNLNRIKDCEHLLFKNGPNLDDELPFIDENDNETFVSGGIGNFMIETHYNDNPFYKLYFLDTKDEASGLYDYDWLSNNQVAWYGNHASNDTVNSSVFMHIPLIEYNEYDEDLFIDPDWEQMGEDRVYSQGVQTGFFDEMMLYGKSEAVFVGHDHLNNFSFYYQGILLAYGQVSGYNGYGNINRGARIINIDETGKLSSSFLLLDNEVDL
jgi:predicted phosphodiesterase